MLRAIAVISIIFLFITSARAQNWDLNQIDSLSQVLKDDIGKGERLSTLVKLARAQLKVDQGAAARESLKEAQNLAEELRNKRLQAEINFMHGYIKMRSGDFGGALADFRSVDSVLKDTDEGKATKAESALKSGDVFALSGNFDSAVYYYNKTQRILDEEKNPFLQSALDLSLGNLYDDINPEIALEKCLSTLKYFEDKEDKYNEVQVLNNLGELYRKAFKDFEKAEEHYLRAIAINEELEQLASLSMNYVNYGILLRENATAYERSLEYTKKGYDIQKASNNPRAIANGAFNMAQVHLALGKNELAKQYYDETLEMSEKGNLLIGKYFGNSGLVVLYLQEKKPNLALKYSEAQLALAQQMGTIDFLLESYESLYKSYKASGDYAKALANLEQVKVYADSIEKQRNADKLLTLRTQYELDQAESENELLKLQKSEQEAKIENKNNTLIGIILIAFLLILTTYILYRYSKSKEKANKKLALRNDEIAAQNELLEDQQLRLKEVNAAKDKLFSIISHDLRAPIASIKGFIEVLKDGGFTEEELELILNKLHVETDSTYKMMDNLLHWAKIQMQGVNTEKVFFKLDQLIQETIRLYAPISETKQIHVINEIAETVVVKADENQIKIVFRNLLSNAIKFTPEHGQITISYEKLETHIKVCIKDTGVGITQESLEKIMKNDHFSTQGTLGEKGTGLGIQLSRGFIENNGGSLSIEKNPTGGSIFCFTLPK